MRDPPAAVFRREDEVMIRPSAESLLFLGGERSDDLTGGAYDHRSRGDLGATEDECPCTDQAVFADHCPVEDDRTHADEAVVTDRAGVDDGGVSHRHATADGGSEIGSDMDDGVVLNVAFLANHDRGDIPAQ